MSSTLPWQFPHPHIETWHITDAHIDHYGHVNNLAYIAQLETLAWAHSNALGLSFADYQTLDRAMVIRSHEINYLKPCLHNDTVLCATWITHCDNKLTLTRKFQYICAAREITVFEAQTVFVCTTLSNGKPARMPDRFKDIYSKACTGVEV